MLNRKGSDKHSLTYVSPYSKPDPNKKNVLSILKPSLNGVLSEDLNFQNNFTVPVLRDVDVSLSILRNDSRLLSSKVTRYRLKDQNNATDSNVTAETADFDIEGSNLKKFVDVDSFVPKNFREQLTTVIIKGFPNIKKGHIEQVLLILAPSENFEWSIVDSELVDHKMVFLRFESIELLRSFQANYSTDIKDILRSTEAAIVVDPSVYSYMDSIDGDVQVDSDLRIRAKDKIHFYLDNLKSHEKHLTSAGTEDLDEVLNYYSNYKIDDNELIDVPSYMKDVIIKDIIRFRSKVLTIEINNRKKELESERIKTRQKLKSIFEGIREVGDEIISEPELSSEREPMEVDEFEDLSEEQYQNYLAERQVDDVNRRYDERLRALQKKETEKQRLFEQLKSLEGYEDYVVDNKFKFIQDLKNFDEFSDIYYTNHSAYLKIRNVQRVKEEQKDLQDRKDEEKEIQEEQHQHTTYKLEVEPLSKIKGFKNNDGTVILQLSETRLRKLRDKITDLIDEYLGIKDEFLILLIYDSLMKTNLDGKESLVEELSQPLDEDANTLVNDLWEFINKLLEE
ncbi:uncharacterized protein PRCAT00001357001 [Priceomyces carsonii]|uniref:uncharacterized protein n=1 Tax=Priceomyces carsonii TaxID=28549 RepID=UPI002EDAF21A|nr:unnamed protein product [Priceomyces carsonii]